MRAHNLLSQVLNHPVIFMIKVTCTIILLILNLSIFNNNMVEKSLFKAYLCLLFGGWFGLHHFYLGRDIQAFLTFATCGGYFTLGLIRDFWRLPEYVKEANNDLDFVKKLKQQMKLKKKPSTSWARQCAFMVIGNLFALLIPYAMPNELLNERVAFWLNNLLVPFASALGVWLVGNVGTQEGSLKEPVLAAYLSVIVAYMIGLQAETLTTLAAIFAFNRYSSRWRKEEKRKGGNRNILVRIIIITCAIALYFALWSSWLYFNCKIEDSETNEMISCREALNNFFTSPAYQNFSQAIWMLIEHVRHEGIINLWKQIMNDFDISGRTNALLILGLDSNAGTQDIVARYKKLSREFHPDKEIDETKKMEKQEKFIQVQTAFKKLVPSTNQRYSAATGRSSTKKQYDKDEL